MREASLLAATALLTCALATASCRKGPCQVAEESGPVFTGSIGVELDDGGTGGASPPCGEIADGTPQSFPIYPNLTLSDSADALTVSYGLRGADGLAHLFELHVDDVHAGATVDLSQHGNLCIASTPLPATCCTSCQDEGHEDCCPMSGTLTVRSVSSTGDGCANANTCAQSIDATLSGTSECAGLPLRFDLTLDETGKFDSQSCPEE